MEARVFAEPVDYQASDYIPPEVQDGFWDRINLTAEIINSVRSPGDAVVDIGCNAGHLLGLIGQPCWGYDIALSPLAEGKRAGHDVRYADVTTDELELASIVSVSEVCEHLTDPHALVAKLNRDPVQYLIASSPYLETVDNHYEQHCWVWDLDGYKAMFEAQGFQVMSQETTRIYQVLLAKRQLS